MPIHELKSFVETIFPLYRSICSPGLDEALERIKSRFIPDLTIEKYPTRSSAWTWTLPQKWELKEGYIESNGKKVIDIKDEPLSVWSGSLPVDGVVSHEELIPHIYTDPSRPDLLCWYFKYYGNLSWGFNLPYNLVKTLDPKAKYQVKIDARYYDDSFRVGSVFVKGKSDKIILLTSDICHPFQCNDSLSGAAVNYKLYTFLKTRENDYSYLFTFVPETIGTIAFLANHESLLPHMVYHIYSEFWGRKKNVRLQKSLRGDSLLDQIASQVLTRRFGGQCKILKFREDGIMNDELVTSMPNLYIPSIAFLRETFEEYHSHKDIPEKLDYDCIEEGYQIIKEVIERIDEAGEVNHEREKGSLRLEKMFDPFPHDARNFIPVPLFKGPVFLSRYDLWVDWRIDPKLNAAIDMMMACMDGKNSVAAIASYVDLPFEKVLGYINKFEEQGLIRKKSINSNESLYEMGKN